MNKQLPDSSALDTKEGPCAICLEETITNPVVLPCGHVFCFSCVGKYQWASESGKASCPYCRGEIPDMVERASERGNLYMGRAFTSPGGSEEQKKYAKLALAEQESCNEYFSQFSREDFSIMLLYFRAAMMTMTDQPEETIKITKEVLSLNEIHPGVLSVVKVLSMRHGLAKAYEACGKWKDALGIYVSMYNEDMQRGETPYSRLFLSLCRVMYEIHDYDTAIKMGKLAIMQNRELPGVHKYVALSHKAQGNVEEAKQLISRAILYEEHWNKDNLRQNKQVLKELSNL